MEEEEDGDEDVWNVGIDPLVRQLIDAAMEGNVGDVGALLDQGAEIEGRDASGWSALEGACVKRHKEVVALLLDRGADVNAADDNRNTPISLASRGGQLEVVELLHARGADIHHADLFGNNALHWAARCDRLLVCEFLLSKGADLMAAANNGNTALSRYGINANRALSPETKALRCAALEAAWAAGPHPSQVRRRRWESRGPLLWVLAEHGYRPLQLRAQAIAAAAVGAPLPMVQYSPKEDVLRSEGLVRYIVAFL